MYRASISFFPGTWISGMRLGFWRAMWIVSLQAQNMGKRFICYVPLARTPRAPTYTCSTALQTHIILRHCTCWRGVWSFGNSDRSGGGGSPRSTYMVARVEILSSQSRSKAGQSTGRSQGLMEKKRYLKTFPCRPLKGVVWEGWSVLR